MTKGIIVKGIGGFYYVKTDDRIYECKARGIFRKDGTVPYVGDLVGMEALSEDEGIIDEILPRKNVFVRPPIANVDCLVLGASLKSPRPSPGVIDKFLVMAEHHHAEILLCLNKTDLATAEELAAFREIYRGVYPLIFTSGETEAGIDVLREALKGKKSALSGPSGVGKSTLLNRLLGRSIALTGEIGAKSKRGKHTTRHVELFELPEGGMLFDTPGFTSFEILDMEEEELAFLYPEMAPWLGSCKYDNCRHLAEPDCRVRKAAEEGEIHPSRYRSYCEQMKELQEKRRY